MFVLKNSSAHVLNTNVFVLKNSSVMDGWQLSGRRMRFSLCRTTLEYSNDITTDIKVSVKEVPGLGGLHSGFANAEDVAHTQVSRPRVYTSLGYILAGASMAEPRESAWRPDLSDCETGCGMPRLLAS